MILFTDFRGSNKKIQRNPWPIPNSQDSLVANTGFKFAAVLDFIIFYYDIMLDEDIQKLYTMVLPWEKYQYQSLYLGIYISPDVFQGETSTLLQEMVQMFIYMYDPVIIRNDPF